MDNLAAKYRPRTFEDVTEQSVVVKMLKNLCSQEDLFNRNFLFIGSAGIGKTTLAKICANYLNDGQGQPIEIDAATHSGVDSIREIVQQARMYPIGSKYKVFIIDECHALSSASWQALLAILESGAAKSIFMFATTNPEKIPATIISRLQVFRLSKISLNGIIDRLKFVLDSEIREGRKLTYTDDAVSFIAKLAKGGMRDAITLLDKCLSYSDVVDSTNILLALNLPNYDDYFSLLQSYSRKDNAGIVNLINKIYNSGVNFVKWFEDFHGFVLNVVKYIYLQDISETMIPIQYKDKISKYGQPHARKCLNLANVLINMNRDLKYTQYLQEVALTYLCSVPPKEIKQ